MEAPSAWEREDRLGNDATGLHHRVECGLQVVDPDDRERCCQCFIRLAVQSQVDIVGGRGRIIRPEIGERPTKGSSLKTARQLMCSDAWKLHIIDASHGPAQ
jgi:hypothetical protein